MLHKNLSNCYVCVREYQGAVRWEGLTRKDCLLDVRPTPQIPLNSRRTRLSGIWRCFYAAGVDSLIRRITQQLPLLPSMCILSCGGYCNRVPGGSCLWLCLPSSSFGPTVILVSFPLAVARHFLLSIQVMHPVGGWYYCDNYRTKLL